MDKVNSACADDIYISSITAVYAAIYISVAGDGKIESHASTAVMANLDYLDIANHLLFVLNRRIMRLLTNCQ